MCMYVYVCISISYASTCVGDIHEERVLVSFVLSCLVLSCPFDYWKSLCKIVQKKKHLITDQTTWVNMQYQLQNWTEE